MVRSVFMCDYFVIKGILVFLFAQNVKLKWKNLLIFAVNEEQI